MIENNLAFVAERQDDLESARDHTERALAILRELDDKPGIAAALGGLGVLAARDGDIEAAERGYREAIKIAEPASAMSGHSASRRRIPSATARSDGTTL